MHCPDCGQQQVNDEIRFCSRCGFPLSLVPDLIAHRGTLPQLAELKKKNKKFLTKKTGVFFGICWTLFFLLIVTTFFELSGIPGIFAEMSAVFGLFTGAVIILASAFFLKSESAVRDRRDEYVDPAPHGLSSSGGNALPPPRAAPAQTYAPPAKKSRWETNDLAPPSVTEGTTKLLDND